MLLAEFTCVEDDSGTWCCINVIRRCIQVSEIHVRNRSYKNSVLPVSFSFFQQQAGSVLGFCFPFLLTLHFLSVTRDVLFYFLFLISVLTSPTPCQELIKGLFVLIAKIVITGSESVKMCCMKQQQQNVFLMKCFVLARARSSANRSDDSSRSPPPKPLPTQSTSQAVYL